MIVAYLKSAELLQAEVHIMTEMICSTTVEQRADLFDKLAHALKLNGQGFTGALIQTVARQS